jgi:hypothetical protein
MKKFFTLCAAMMMTAAVFAQEETTFSFVHDNQVVANGGTVNITSADYNGIDLGSYTVYASEYNAHLYAKNNTNAEATFIATIEELTHSTSDNLYVSICTNGTCSNLSSTANSVSQTMTIAAGESVDLMIEVKGPSTSDLSVVQSFENKHNSSTRVSLQLQGDPDDITTITLNMGKSFESGIASVANTNKVALHGRTLNYKFANAGTRTLRVYNVSGAAVMSQKLNGTAGTVQLNNLPAGIYIYKVAGTSSLCGKVVLK